MFRVPAGLVRTWRRSFGDRMAAGAERGQAALVAVVAFSVLASAIGAALIMTVIASAPLQQAKSVQIYANRALEAGVNAYWTAVNTNPSLAQCNSNTNSSGLCSGLSYGTWNFVPNSNTSGADAEYYAFGNPQPTFDSVTNALTSIAVQVVGAAQDNATTNHYLFASETITLTPSNGFLKNVWWSNFESYSANGNYNSCNYNWKLNYNIDNANVGCTPVYFGPADYLFGPVYTNDSVFVAGNGSPSSSPSFGTTSAPSPVTTADPNCLFVNDNYGMSGSDANCASVDTGSVALYDTTNSSYGHAIETPPASDSQLGIIASQNGCLYSGPTQITLSTAADGTGQMTVVSPDTIESTVTSNGTNYTWDNNNIASNLNPCPNNGTAPLPPNGVVFVQNAPSNQTQAWANPFDDPVDNTVTNLASNPSPPRANNAVTLTATVTSDSNQIDKGATVAFSQTTNSRWGGNQTAVIGSCSAVSLSAPVAVTPATSPPSYKSTATCSTTEASNGTGAFSAAYSGGNSTGSSSANLGQTYTLTPSKSFGPYAQVTAGGCSGCYYGQTSTPDSEGDAFVNGTLSGQLTIGTANDLVVDGNISYNDCKWTTGNGGSTFCPYNLSGTNDSLGLIAEAYAEIGHPVVPGTNSVAPACAGTPAATCDPSNGGNGITIDAAILALNQSFAVNNYGDGTNEGGLDVYGSIQQFARGPVGTFSGTQTVSGYVKHYTWDPLLDFISPPSYLVPSTASWVLGSISTNAGVSGTSVCPPLLAPYGSAAGSVLTQYCSATPGGLPNYPSATAPSPPTMGTATANANGTVTVTWTDPSSNGSPITGYTVSPYPPCSSCSGTSVSGGGATSATITGLTPGGSYTFTVSATNALGTSDPSGRSNSVTIPGPPSPPTNAAAAVQPDGSVTVSWTDPTNSGSPISSYSITPSPACASCTGTSVSNGSATSSNIRGLAAGTAYTFTVTATNGLGTSGPSAPSNSVTTPNVPGAPTIGSATAGSGQANVSWAAPGNNGGSPITGYIVTPYVGATAQTPQTFVSTATTEVVTGLTNGTSYTFTVKAVNGVGTGPASGASNAVTPASVPGAPNIGTVTGGARGSVVVNFTAPASDGGSPITSYTVTATDVTRSWRGGQTATGTGSPITVTGLRSGDTYTFTVKATNAIGTGPASSASAQINSP